MNPLKVLIACEESQRVCIEFRKLGMRHTVRIYKNRQAVILSGIYTVIV